MIANADAILSSADLVAVIGARVPLRQIGANLWVGPCPWHQSKTSRSFQVTPGKGWYCFGCEIGGGLASFVERFESCTFPEAVERIAADTGQRVEYAAGSTRSTGPSREDVLAALEAACRHYQAMLSDPAGDNARDYWAARGFTPETATAWRIGYACGNTVADCGAAPSALVAAGVLRTGKTGDTYDPLAGRLILPFLDPAGRVVAFAGRALAADCDRKYINTADTSLWKKTHHLYGRHAAAALLRQAPAGERWLHLCEGQLKVIACHTAAIPAVALGGTAFSQRHLAEIVRLAPARVVVCPDPDPAGTTAARRILETLRQEDITCQVGTLHVPDQCSQPVKDPDDLLRLGYPIAYDYHSPIDWLYDALRPDGTPPATPEDLADLLRDTAPLISSAPDRAVQVAEYARLAALCGCSESDLRARRPAAATEKVAPMAAPASAPAPHTQMTASRYLCALLLQIDAGNDPLWWSRSLHVLDYDPDLLTYLRWIYRAKRFAADRAISTADAIERAVPAAMRPQLLYWLALALPRPATLDAILEADTRVADLGRAAARKRALSENVEV